MTFLFTIIIIFSYFVLKYKQAVTQNARYVFLSFAFLTLDTVSFFCLISLFEAISKKYIFKTFFKDFQPVRNT